MTAGLEDFGPSKTNPATAGSNELILDGDFFDYDDSFKPSIPEGRFLTKVDSVSLHYNEVKRSVSYLWKLTVLEGPGAGKNNNYYTYIGRKGPDGKLTEGENGSNARRFLRAIGITPELTPEYFDANKRMRLPPDAVINRQFYATFIHKTEKGNDGNPVIFVNVAKVEPFSPVGAKFTGLVAVAGTIPNMLF